MSTREQRLQQTFAQARSELISYLRSEPARLLATYRQNTTLATIRSQAVDGTLIREINGMGKLNADHIHGVINEYIEQQGPFRV